jgi:hypothetical protein
MDSSTRDKIKRKFETAYVIVKENLSFSKMKSICQLEERHGADLGKEYQNDKGCATFVEFIAKEQQEILQKSLESCNFFSIQADGTTDAGNKEVEMFLVVYFDHSSQNGKVVVKNKFFGLRNLKSATAEGLLESFKRAMESVHVDSWQTKMIGFGCDGANVNIAQGGLKGLLQKEQPWIFVFWCLAHRLELSLKDATKGTFFTTIDDLLLRLYYLYEKSPKKCRELEGIVEILRSSMEEMPARGGIRPIRACGTRFVAHKVAALERVTGMFGAYVNHLITLSQDSSVRPIDREKLKGYVRKWQTVKVVLGCALFFDILKSLGVLCQVLQADELCVVRAIQSVMKTKKALDKLKATALVEYPTVKKVLQQMKHEEGQSYTYQGIELKEYDSSVSYLESHYVEWVTSIEDCLRERLKFQDIDLLTVAITILATNGWERSESPSFAYEALDLVCQRFKTPLERASVDLAKVQEEWDDMVSYAKQYLNLVQDDYKVIWWKLFNAVDSKDWSNILIIIELLFCLPLSNGRLERLFSQLKLIKTQKRANLQEVTLENLLRIHVEGPPVSEWDPSVAVDLWYREKVRRVNQPEQRKSHTSVTAEEEEESACIPFLLDDWEEWIAD